MIIQEVKPIAAGILQVITEEGRSGTIDLKPFMDTSPVFSALRNWDDFVKVRNGKYYIEWICGADLSSDTLEACMTWDG
jgi:hypothetical protein